MSGPPDSTSSRVSSERPSLVLRHPLPQSCRLVDLRDPAMRTMDERFDEPTLNRTPTVPFAPTGDIKQDADSSAVIHLHDAIHPTAGKDRRGGSRARRLSMTTLVIDLALAVKRKMSFHSSRA
ncbi:hypothetical protein FIBSPDRAFT_947379 [Athelia psychrophila]|uniref:Uncharacterized protein n=1 Tax=Athelia psychrophila TaxID=1759441 RepID=A0A166S3Y5_9AGAM|nr:hypothetical protein FIBSPDRAFT_947379 [Fibularhizoctonia sp. CBS 109695]